MKNSTIIFLIKKEENKDQILLAMKKRGFGVGLWNGVGGKVQEGESIEGAAKRECAEEISVNAKILEKVAEIFFDDLDHPEWNQCVHVFICKIWIGVPHESEEMDPKWFEFSEIQYDKMWVDDIYWLPIVLRNHKIKASFVFGGENKILDFKIETMTEFKSAEKI